jgi:hypothetical protein
MQDQLENLRRGEINCLVGPDPRFIDELLSDKIGAANIRDLYIGGDLSDSRLGRLLELPNLKCVVFLFADDPGDFLKRLHGKASIEEMTLEHAFLSRNDMAEIGSFPHLKSLGIGQSPNISELEGLRRHPSLERLVLARANSDPNLIPLLQSMPRLRDVAIGVCDGKTNIKVFQTSLRAALPRCRCRVWDDCR